MQLEQVKDNIEFAAFTYDPINNDRISIELRQVGGIICAVIKFTPEHPLSGEDLIGTESSIEDHMMDPTNYNGLKDFTAHVTGIGYEESSIKMTMIFIDEKDDHDEEHHTNIILG